MSDSNEALYMSVRDLLVYQPAQCHVPEDRRLKVH